ncbi:MAG: ABC transporter ATP-binding protein [Sedimentitalea sp.]|uniref:ABC transporter ATP-binding protein n=1 Tax=Sedimentitalea sp. TaxID=2048915 RepID=UPI00326339A0
MTLELRDIVVSRRGKSILNGVSVFPFKQGEFIALVGPNGAGKSTLLRALSQTLPYQGSAVLNGQDLAKMKQSLRSDLVGYLPQNLQSQTDLTVLESLLVAMHAGGGKRMQAAVQMTRFDALLSRFSIAHLTERPLSSLSGGQRQTVGLAQSLVRDPTLLLLDEPTAALDLAMQFRILSELQLLAREGRIVIAVLHDLSQAARWADRIVVLHEGCIHGQGSPGNMLTPDVLAEVYKISARVEHDSKGNLITAVDGLV